MIVRIKIKIQNKDSLKRFIKNKFSNNIFKDIKYNGFIFINNSYIKKIDNIILEKNDKLDIFLNEKQKEIKSFDHPLSIVYEDNYFIVINKPSGILSIPNYKSNKTIVNILASKYKRIHLVNRLDKFTSGMIIIAKNKYIKYLFDKKIANNEIEKKYYALVDKELNAQKINKPIGRKENSIIKREINDKGKESLTIIESCKPKNNVFILKIKIITGRTHQIRIHLKSLGTQIIGDDLYGNIKSKIFGLKAYYLKFNHPITNKELIFELDDSFKNRLEI